MKATMANYRYGTLSFRLVVHGKPDTYYIT